MIMILIIIVIIILIYNNNNDNKNIFLRKIPSQCVVFREDLVKIKN